MYTAQIYTTEHRIKTGTRAATGTYNYFYAAQKKTSAAAARCSACFDAGLSNPNRGLSPPRNFIHLAANPVSQLQTRISIHAEVDTQRNSGVSIFLCHIIEIGE